MFPFRRKFFFLTKKKSFPVGKSISDLNFSFFCFVGSHILAETPAEKSISQLTGSERAGCFEGRTVS